MNDVELNSYLADRGIDPKARSGLYQFFIFAVIIILLIFLLSQIIQT
jgi:hypothetical protein